MAYTDTITAKSTKVKYIHYKEIESGLTDIKNKVALSSVYNPDLTVDTSKPTYISLEKLREAINGYQSKFSGNCNCLMNMNCNQACQSTCASQACQSTCASQACQSQCSSANQSCQTSVNQSCQSSTNQKCQMQYCQSCQTQCK